MDFNDKKVLILGMGREGNTTLQYLQKQYPKADITTADQKDPGTYPTSLEGWDIVIVSPGVKPSVPLLKTAKQITTATNVFFDECKGKIVAVTGSKGKSTTSSLIHAMIPGSYLVGNIGNAALGELLHHNDEEDVFVFELSSAQASRLTKGPHMTVALNLFPEHMDYHGSVEQYYADKMNVARVMNTNQTLVHNAKDEELLNRLEDVKCKKTDWEDVKIPDVSVPLEGAHNAENVRAAMKVAKLMGVDDATIKAAIESFKPLPHRLEFVGEFKDIQFYNDSISTTPESTIAALEALENVGTLMVGGLDRGYDFAELAQKIVEKKVANVVIFPDSGQRILKILEDDYTGNVLETDSMETAVQWAYENTPKGTICLLSPGSPSYNLYTNFEERGEVFKGAVGVKK